MTADNVMKALEEDFARLEKLGVKIQGVATDSRAVRPGDAFLAYPGQQRDGRNFIPQAIAAGACAVLWEAEGFEWDPRWQVPHLPVRGLREKAGFIASRVYGEPSRSLWMIGVTGTNGKTSCSHWIAQTLTGRSSKCAVVGTLGYGFPGNLAPASHTTPDPAVLQSHLARFLRKGARAVAMEVSSHALAQGRVNGVHFDVALFTNLSRDHLDYHGHMDAYGAAKARLFTWPELKYAVLNLDDTFGADLAAKLPGTGPEVLGYGFTEKAVQIARRRRIPLVRGKKLALSGAGLAFEARTPWGRAAIRSPLLGRFNAENLLAVLAVLLVSQVPLQEAAQALERVESLPGRMERLGGGEQALVVVDYAHTPDALEKVLTALREALGKGRPDTGHGKPKLICVFGCGGERDRGKRPLMGEVATRLADSVIVTSDNPRGEDPLTIIDDIVQGAAVNYRVIEDRATAIFEALRQARKGDVVLLAGKGHENYQEIKGERLPFSDSEVARLALAQTAQRWPA